MILGLNHIGIAVESIDQTLRVLSEAFGAQELDRKSYPELGQTSCMGQLKDSLLELMEPIGTQGVVPKFLAVHGQGLHHVSLLTDGLAQLLSRSAASACWAIPMESRGSSSPIPRIPMA